MQKIILFIVVFIVSLTGKSQTIPVIKSETISKKDITIPADLKGKFSLLCFASSQKAQPDLESWLEPVYQKFVAKTGIMDDMYDVNVFFIPVLTGTNLTFKASIKRKFDENVQSDLKEHVIFCTENSKQVLASLNIQDDDVPYLFLLDKDGNVIYKTSGKYSDEKFEKIDDLLE
jgi:hypothetical protein